MRQAIEPSQRNAEAQARHRVGLKSELREIKTLVAALHRDLQAALAQQRKYTDHKDYAHD